MGRLQYLSLRHSERLAECGIRPSVVSSGNPYNNALAESIIGLFKTEIIERRRPWTSIEAVEFEQACYRQQEAHAIAA